MLRKDNYVYNAVVLQLSLLCMLLSFLAFSLQFTHLTVTFWVRIKEITSVKGYTCWQNKHKHL